jgi:hypothetical protein
MFLPGSGRAGWAGRQRTFRSPPLFFSHTLSSTLLSIHPQASRRARAPAARAGTKVDDAATANALDFDELTDVIR